MAGNGQPVPLQHVDSSNVQNILGGAPQTPSLFTHYSTQTNQVRQQNDNLRQQLGQLQTNYDTLQQQHTQAQASNQALQKQVDDMTKKVELLVLEIRILRGEPLNITTQQNNNTSAQ